MTDKEVVLPLLEANIGVNDFAGTSSIRCGFQAKIDGSP